MKLIANWFAVAAALAGILMFQACGRPGVAIRGNPDAGPLMPTEKNLKVAFIGDTGSSDNFKSVLRLIKREEADFVMIQGDLAYGSESSFDWFRAIDSELQTGATQIPYFVARGNHDTDWGNIGVALKDRLAKWAITPEHNDPTLSNYSLVYKGLKMVFVHESETNPSRAQYVADRLLDDTQIWRICSWHKNQRNSNVGPKVDEMGWEIFENCRNNSAIVAQGHSHTYSRSRTLTIDSSQTVDPACNTSSELCVGPGRHFFFDSSLGGVKFRSLYSTAAALPHWASVYSGDFGALFIEFFVDGNPMKARGYFKTVNDVEIDSFTITRLP